MIPHHWNRAAADNGSADPNADLRPSRPANTVLGSIRGLMATGAAARDDAIGELVATLGANNVYSVQSNEGLIDIATGINGVPAAITKPFLLRLSFGTALTGTATNVPHLVVDGFDCGPILRNDGTPLTDGDLTLVRPVLVLGDMAATTDTKVTRVRVVDLVPSQYGQVAPPYTQFVDGTFTVPVMSDKCDVEIWGGGGGSGGVGSTGNGSSSGGGGGGYSRKRLTVLTIGSTLTLIVGAPGTPGAQGGYGGPGGTTSLGSYCSSTGGQGGSPNGVGTGGAGGSGSGGDVNLTGGYGAAGADFGSATGGNGGGASQGGGAGGGGAPGIGAPGTAPGGGGGGSGSTTINTGAAGAPGGCIVTWR